MTVQTGAEDEFSIQVYIDDLDPDSLQVQLYAEGRGGDGPVRLAATRVRPLVGTTGGYVYQATAPATRGAADYTARIVPNVPGVAVPLGGAEILWQR